MQNIMKRFIGDKAFYKRVFMLTLPILVQNIITNFVSLIDNIMVGRVGTEEMSGVAIVNQIIFVFNLCIFGAISGVGIFSAQFHGKGDVEGVRNTFRIKLILVAVIAVAAEIVFIFWGDDLINKFLHEGKENIDIEKTFDQAKIYLSMMLVGLPPFALMQAYSDTLRSTNETVLPMKASVVAVVLNMSLNYVLIYGEFGAPRLGVLGAAIATVTARFAECIIVVSWTHVKKNINKFIVGAYSSFKVPAGLVKEVIKKGSPLMMNEALWAFGMTTIVKAYSEHGLEVISAQNISSTVSNLFNCAFFAFGNAIAIIIGQHLGSGQLEKAKEDDRRLIFACIVTCIVIGSIMALIAPLFPQIYNTSDAVKKLAGQFLTVSAILMPIQGFAHASYFTLRSGGKTLVTFVFDSVFVWVISIPAAFALTNFTNLPILPLYTIVQCLDIIKVIIGLIMLKSGIWVNNLVGENKSNI
jgi:putative MATE family efflux protein